jgi:hypothetical protein
MGCHIDFNVLILQEDSKEPCNPPLETAVLNPMSMMYPPPSDGEEASTSPHTSGTSTPGTSTPGTSTPGTGAPTTSLFPSARLHSNGSTALLDTAVLDTAVTSNSINNSINDSIISINGHSTAGTPSNDIPPIMIVPSQFRSPEKPCHVTTNISRNHKARNRELTAGKITTLSLLHSPRANIRYVAKRVYSSQSSLQKTKKARTTVLQDGMGDGMVTRVQNQVNIILVI